MSLNDNRDILRFDGDVDLVEREPNMFTFIPDSSSTVTHHLERESWLKVTYVVVKRSVIIGLYIQRVSGMSKECCHFNILFKMSVYTKFNVFERL